MKHTRKTKGLLPVLCAAGIALLAGSCTDDALLHGGALAKDDGRHILFSIRPSVGADIEVGTRGVAASPEETAIYTLRAFVFSADGNAIPEKVFQYFDRDFQSVFFGDGNIDDSGNVISGAKKYDTARGLALPVIDQDVYFSVTKKVVGEGEDAQVQQTIDVYGSTAPEGYTGSSSETNETNYYLLSPAQLKECQIWVVANMGRWEGSEVNHVNDNRSDLEHVETIDDLKHFYGIRGKFKHEDDEGMSNRPFLPMIGTLREEGQEVYIDATDAANKPQTFDLTQANSYSAPKTVYLDQIVTKVRFRIEPLHYYNPETGERKWYEFYFDSWTVKNMSRYIYLAPHKRDIYDNMKGADTDGNDPEADHRDSFIKLMNSRLGTAGSTADLSMMFYPHDDAAEATDEINALLHDGKGDGSKKYQDQDQDWIAVDGDPFDNAVDNGAEGCSPVSSDVNGNDFIEQVGEDGPCYYYFYTYGNRRGKGLGAPNTSNLGGGNYEKYPEDLAAAVGSMSAAKKKTLCAPENASFLVIKGMVRERTSETEVSVRSVIYTIALGANMDDDYNLKRNTCYTYNIKINGMTEDDIEVTVDADGNGSYNSSVHQRVSLDVKAPYASEIDAHADMRYIQFHAGDGDVEIQLYNTYADATSATLNADGTIDGKMGTNEIATYTADNNNSNWLKLVDASTSDAQKYCAGDYTAVYTKDGNEYRTGFDKEDSSGEPSVTEETFWFAGIDDPITCGRYESGDPHTIFVYADEITSLDGLQTDDEAGLKYRSAWLMVKNHYDGTKSAVLDILKSNPGKSMFIGDEDPTDTHVEVYQLIELRQYAPIEKPIDLEYTNTDGTVSKVTKKLWIERFEEYGMHLDPRRDHDYSTDGLEWGWDIHLGSAEMSYTVQTGGGPGGGTSTTYKETYDFSEYRPCYNMPADAVKLTHDFSTGTDIEYNGLSNTTSIVAEASKSLTCSSYGNHSYYNGGYSSQPKNARYKDFAARYCHYKTRRDADGKVSSDNTKAWYLPSIGEMKLIVAMFSGEGDSEATLALQNEKRIKQTDTDAFDAKGVSHVDEFRPYSGNSSQVNASSYTDQASWLEVVLGKGLRGKQYWSSTVPTSSAASQLATDYKRSVNNWPQSEIATYLTNVYTDYARTCFNSEDVVNQTNFMAPSVDVYQRLYIVDKKELLYYGRIYAGYYNGTWYMYKTTDSETGSEYGVYFTKYPDRKKHYHVRAVRVAP